MQVLKEHFILPQVQALLAGSQEVTVAFNFISERAVEIVW
jgi:hypothetical protein